LGISETFVLAMGKGFRMKRIFSKNGRAFTLRFLVIFLAAAAYPVGAQTVKWTQAPDPNGWDVNMTRVAGQPRILADDFLCTATGPITDLHIWTSFAGGGGNPVNSPYLFNLSIWSDVAASGSVPSHPGQQLWSVSGVEPTSFSSIDPAGAEGWYDPYSKTWVKPDHNNYFLYNFLLSNPYIQMQGTIYWLAVQAIPLAQGAAIGWKTSLQHWNDDAAYGNIDGSDIFWAENELLDPTSGQSLDLAFEVTTSASVPDVSSTVWLLSVALTGLFLLKRRY
jgi:hypothetical protein